ncbi:MAG: YbaK/EbsC family protein [Patescibacteria group bacterium]|nr:hypothetical protein [Patescibacteria group bacterium]
MKPLEKLVEFLKQNNVPFKQFHHAPVRTSEEALAQRPDFILSQGAKAIIVNAKKSSDRREFIMLVLPADKRLDSKKVRKILKCKSFSFAHESDVIRISDGVEPGGVHPFGNLFGLSVYVDNSLALNDEIIFNAGDRSVSLAMKCIDYLKVVRPKLCEFATK